MTVKILKAVQLEGVFYIPGQIVDDFPAGSVKPCLRFGNIAEATKTEIAEAVEAEVARQKPAELKAEPADVPAGKPQRATKKTSK